MPYWQGNFNVLLDVTGLKGIHASGRNLPDALTKLSAPAWDACNFRDGFSTDM